MNWRKIDWNSIKSKYIPVGNPSYYKVGLHWWQDDSVVYYPFTLVSIEMVNSFNVREEINLHDKTTFFSDSGGFQYISGLTNLTPLTSLLNQIKVKSDVLFAFDKPPVRKPYRKLTYFEELPYKEYYERLDENWKTALEQSQWLKDNYPDKLKKFYFVLHARDKKSLNYNLELMDKDIGGIENYKKHFGGVCYAVKKEDPLYFGATIAHAKQHFLNRGLPVHMLGIGSLKKMVYMIKAGITTFDSTNAIRGCMGWNWMMPIGIRPELTVTLKDKGYPFAENWCDCPACEKYDMKKMIKEKDNVHIPVAMTLHNLHQMVREMLFLNSLKKDQYNEIVTDVFKSNKTERKVMELMDYAEDEGFDKAYSKYEHDIKVDVKKVTQSTLG